ncbi:MAG TPA: hypothetical protein VKH35_11695 [Thermoanaerobaculia bacterium]|nr:hypothetical protein [Thermoanaerobaculia bacterium]
MRITALVSVLALFTFSSVALAAEKPVTVKGEVVDTMCYAAMGARGEGHAKCGIKCAKSGIPVGLVEGNKMYILLPAKDGEGLPAAVIDHMGKVVSVTGHTYESGGNAFLTVDSVR